MDDVLSPVECYGYQGGLNVTKRRAIHPLDSDPVLVPSDESMDSDEMENNRGFLTDSDFEGRASLEFPVTMREKAGGPGTSLEKSSPPVTPAAADDEKRWSPRLLRPSRTRSAFTPSPKDNFRTSFTAKYSESVKTQVLSISTPISAEKGADLSMLFATPYSPFMAESTPGNKRHRRRRASSARRVASPDPRVDISPSYPYTAAAAVGVSRTRISSFEKYTWSPLAQSTLERSWSSTQYVADTSYLFVDTLSTSHSSSWEPTYEERMREALDLLYKKRYQDE